jgi:hypothetical protein
MKLRTFYKHNEKLVLGTFAEGKTQFFFSGFNSAEEAKEITLNAHVEHIVKNSKPNPQGIKPSTSLIKSEVEMVLNGEWSEIE